MPTCIFCRIIAGELESARIGGNDLAIAFLDIHPVNPGHTLVIPRRHVASFTELTAAEAAAVVHLVQRIAGALKAKLPNCEGVSIALADGEAAGQDVPHAHFHVIPRHRGDGFGWRRLGQSAERGQLEELAHQIRQATSASEHL